MRNRLVLILVLLPCACSAKPKAPAGGPALQKFHHDLPALGTRFHVTFFAPDKRAATSAAEAVAARLTDLEAKLSPDSADSELSRLSAGAGGPPRKVGDDLFAVLDMGQRVARRTDGAFDVTAGPYLALWRRAAEAGTEPGEEQLEVVRPLVGWSKLRLDPIERTAALEATGMRLDPQGVSLGYACDRVLDELKKHNVDRAYVETEPGPFGRVRVFGSPPPGATGWGLIVPSTNRRRTPGPVPTIANTALSSSPDGGVVNPLTGKAERPRTVAVVAGRSGVTTAPLAAAAAVLGRERAARVVQAAGAAVRFEAPSGR